ncbi:virulence factor TspB C-terminal domain-related protein [Stenotrophomonas sp. VV52]|uniref:virulence factor TspB C-terminal domain-related protein n=1 Tax=Stenotrophomonas sp. VV52 TaxID=2066958 RepID=UPI000C9DCA7A|nr:virulence factor TspB C-terminal domain-related protein [Stenotrophomonas sp. VV52]
MAIRNALTGTGGSVDPGTSLPGSGAWQGGQGTDPIQPDTSGYGWGGGSCPAIPAIDVMGATIQFDPAPLCNWLGLGSYFVMGLAALASLRIVAGKDS